ncbi:hypothetical protein EJB05_35474 [Eragrostis curvula]|uniref:Alpha/beta hydrolase fold-3 domain-containing protein n=1 Tax=Eragrostis curvula TaxID=38414 RepID=A0A5J9U850_9POAL|nr:hypothetical protein EJB05_35474 [Eragrostis curvula]
MAGSDEVNRNECKTAVPLHTWVLISNFKVAYNMLRRPDGTFDRHLAEYLDRRVGPDATPKEGVSSFDHVIDPSVGLEVRIYRGRTESERRLDGKYFVTLQDRDWYWKAYLPEDADRDHPSCNPFGPNGRRLQGLPFTKSLIIVSGLDLTCDRQLAYAEGLQADGHEVKLVYREKATIGFYLLPNTDHYHEVMEEIADFLQLNLE